MVAGYDTTANTISYAAYELTKDKEAQLKLQAEIDAAYEEDEAKGGSISYAQVVQGMPYLEMVILEALRLHGKCFFFIVNKVKSQCN